MLAKNKRFVLFMLVLIALGTMVSLYRRCLNSGDRINEFDILQNRTLYRPKPFLPDEGEVMVQLHIPKTSGRTFMRSLHELEASPLCRNCNDTACTCVNAKTGRQWLYTWFTVGFTYGTNVHTPLSELKSRRKERHLLVNQKVNHMDPRNDLAMTPFTVPRYVYVTMLREPVSRSTSEWLHITGRRIARFRRMFNEDRYDCADPLHVHPACLLDPVIRNRTDFDSSSLAMIAAAKPHAGSELSVSEQGGTLPFSGKYIPVDPEDMPLELFLECHNNGWINRQVLVLSDFTKYTCPPLGGYSVWKRTRSNTTARAFWEHSWRHLLESAKKNLQELDYFGLVEYQELSRQLFEWTFDMKFGKRTPQLKTKTQKLKQTVDQESARKIIQMSAPDIELYKFAKEIFFQRTNAMQASQKSENKGSREK